MTTSMVQIINPSAELHSGLNFRGAMIACWSVKTHLKMVIFIKLFVIF